MAMRQAWFTRIHLCLLFRMIMLRPPYSFQRQDERLKGSTMPKAKRRSSCKIVVRFTYYKKLNKLKSLAKSKSKRSPPMPLSTMTKHWKLYLSSPALILSTKSNRNDSSALKNLRKGPQEQSVLIKKKPQKKPRIWSKVMIRLTIS